MKKRIIGYEFEAEIPTKRISYVDFDINDDGSDEVEFQIRNGFSDIQFSLNDILFLRDAMIEIADIAENYIKEKKEDL